MKAIILAGGSGTKFFPYDLKWQKACIPIGNKPNLLRIIDQLKAMNIKDITVITDYKSKQVDFCLRKYPEVKTENTTPDVINKTIFDVANNTDTLIYYGDVYASDNDVSKVIERFSNEGTTMLLEKKGKQTFRYSDYISAQVKDGKVEKIYGHPREHYVNSRTCGIYAISAKLMQYIKTCPETFNEVPVGGMPPEGFFLEQCLNIAIEDGHTINAQYVDNLFVDIDFPWDILFANEKYCVEEVGNLQKSNISENAIISETAKINGHLIAGENSVIGDNVIIEGNCIVGENTVIDNGAIIGENCVIGNESTIKNFCKISSNSVIGNKNKIGFTAEFSGVTFDRVSMVHHSQVYGVIGKATDIAAGCLTGALRFDDLENPNKVKGKIYTNKFSNAVFIGDYTRTGVGNIFLPGVKIGSNCALGPGTIIQKDVKNNKLVTLKQDLNFKDWGLNKYGW